MNQWLRLCASIAEDMGLIPGRETEILHSMLPFKKAVNWKCVFKFLVILLSAI